MGAYAVEYITSSAHPQRGYYEIDFAISYRRTAEQVKAVVNATSTEAVYSLLEGALAGEKEELAVRIGYWDGDSREAVETAMAELRAAQGIEGAPYWAVNYYPTAENAGLVEFLLDAPAPEEPLDAMGETPEQGEGMEGAETGGQEKTSENFEKSVDKLSFRAVFIPYFFATSFFARIIPCLVRGLPVTATGFVQSTGFSTHSTDA